MTEKQLEADEIRIDQILQKIIKANAHAKDLLHLLKQDVSGTIGHERVRMISILLETIENLALLADDIDIQDERLTKELEKSVRKELQEAVKRIASASKIV